MKLDELRNKKVNRAISNEFNPAIAAIEETIRCANRNLKWLENHGQAPIEKPNYLFSYTDPWSQGCYVLRYVYAYAYEYINLYLQMISEYELPDIVKVLSLGCGSMIDAWSLQEATKRNNLNPEIFYTGVDVVRWNKNYEPRTNDNVHKTMILGKAGEFLATQSELDFDILIFPKSLGDIAKADRNDYKKIITSLKNLKIKQDRFIIAFSFIKYKDNNQSDSDFSDGIISCLSGKGYRFNKTSYVYSDEYISSQEYPRIDTYLWDQTEILTGKKPISRRNYEKYYIYEFRKVNC